jgi:folylpolyglutamate synthase/dihydropteroate synthase
MSCLPHASPSENPCREAVAVTARWELEDEPFFREWSARRPGEKRSLVRARMFGDALGLDWEGLPATLTIVGSKGKGTAVAHATAVLAAAGRRVGTIVSPAFRRNSERIRLGGQALQPGQYSEISGLAKTALEQLPVAGDGYLSPTGAYTIAGVSWLTRHGVDSLVVEEGLGGVSDEVSLLPPAGVAVTPIFEEHIGVLGLTRVEIAEDLLGVVRSGVTQTIWTAAQAPEVSTVLQATAERSGAAVHLAADVGWAAEFTRHVPGLGAANAALGAAAAAWLAERGGRVLDYETVRQALANVALPGRLSVHPATSTRRGVWVVDAAISPEGVEEALAWVRGELQEPELVIASFPDVKDAAACFAALGSTPFIAATAGETYLDFTTRGDWDWQGVHEVLPVADRVPGVVLCLGTISFVGEVLEHLDAPTDRFW